MNELTDAHRIAYDTAVKVIKRKAEKRRKWDQRFWFIFAFILLCITFFVISKEKFDTTYLAIIAIISFVLFVILPLNQPRDMSAKKIERAISKEIKKQNDDLNFIERQRDLREKAAKLGSEQWSNNIEAAREEWKKLQPGLDDTIATLKLWGEKLEMALEFSNQKVIS